MIKRNSNVSLLLGILILVAIVGTSSIFSNQAFADSGTKVKTYLENKKKQEEEIAKAEAEKQAKAEAEKKALEEQKAKEEAEKKALEEQKAKEEAEANQVVDNNVDTTTEDTADTTTEDTADTTTEDTADTTTEDTADTTTEETIPEVVDNSADSSDTTDTSNEETSSETDEIGQTPVNEDPVIVETPIEDVETENPMHVIMDHIEDSPDGKMVYIKGDGARESSKIIITIFEENNDEIVELGIYSTNSGEFSTIWIAEDDMNIDSTYLIKAQDNSNTAEVAFKLNGEIVEIVNDNPVETATNDGQAGDLGMEAIDSLKEQADDPNIGLEQKVGILQSLVSAMQGIITTLSTTLQNYQSQIDDEAKARQAADDELTGKLNEISAKPYKLVSYQRAMYITVASGEQSSHTITCPDEDVAQNGGIDIKSEEVTHFKTFTNRMEGSNSWLVQASNTNPTESVEMTLYINCLKVEANNPITTASETEQTTS